MKTRYEHPKNLQWWLEVQWMKGQLKSVTLSPVFFHCPEEKTGKVLKSLHDQPEETQTALARLGFVPVGKAEPRTPYQITVWLSVWKETYTTAYELPAAEAAMLAGIKEPEERFAELVKAYLETEEWYANPKSVSNLRKHLNQIRLILVEKPEKKEVYKPRRKHDIRTT